MSGDRINGPTARVRQYAAAQPGTLVSWSEVRNAYGTGIVRSHSGPRPAAAEHKMSISNVLRRHFTRVEGVNGLYVLSTSMSNLDREEDEMEMRTFHAIHGCDEFGMSLSREAHALQRRLKRTGPLRMSDIVTHRPGCDTELFEAAQSACGCEEQLK